MISAPDFVAVWSGSLDLILLALVLVPLGMAVAAVVSMVVRCR